MAVNVWKHTDMQILMEFDSFDDALKKAKLINKYLKYCRKISPSTKAHRRSNNGVHNKIMYELHGWNGYVHQLLSYHKVLVLTEHNNKAALYLGKSPYIITSGVIPNNVDADYMLERSRINLLRTSKYYFINNKLKLKYHEYQIVI